MFAETCSAKLKFTAKNCDSTTGLPDSDDGYEDDYVVSNWISLKLFRHLHWSSDFFSLKMLWFEYPTTFNDRLKPHLALHREEMGCMNELQETFSLSAIRTLDEAVCNIKSFLCLQPCEWLDKVTEGKSAHFVLFSGRP
jgi:coatomer protein complex subunit gamma